MSKNKMKLLREGGLRNINKLSERYPKAKIYFHQDLDGVTTAIAMKKYLEDNGIDVVDAEIIQYGDREFAVKKLDAKGDVMPVLVDFAHGKPMFVIHTDHHDTQIGTQAGASKQFRGARSNVETISQVVSPSDIFPSMDIQLINTVDSADYVKYNITPDNVVNFLFRLDKDQSLRRNKILLGLVINKLLLAFKNKPGFLEGLVLDSNPSLLSILNNIKKWMLENNSPSLETLQQNSLDYASKMKTYPNLSYEDKIIFQYGGGSMIKPGSFDRYTPFRNHPEADFLIMAWPMGLLQVSCNPFKSDRGLKGVNLGEMAKEVLSKWEGKLKEKKISLSTIKWISESSINPESVGFTFDDFIAVYGDKYMSKKNGPEVLDTIEELMSEPFVNLSDSDKELLDMVEVTAWDIITANSGGHKCITNISGLNYLGRSNRPPDKSVKYSGDKKEAAYVTFTKMLANEFREKLLQKIRES